MVENSVFMSPGQAAAFLINSVLALSLNSLIYYFVYRNARLRTPFNFTILNVSFADILVSLNLMSSTIYVLAERNQLMDGKFCDVTGFVTLLSFVGSVMCLAAVSFNRYLLICHRNIYNRIFTEIGIAVYILGVWVFSVLISMPPFLGWSRFSYHSGKSICFADWKASIPYMIFMIAVCFCGPILVTLLSLYFILKTKRSTEYKLECRKEDENLGEIARARRDAKRQRVAKEERKITISIVVIAVVFMIAWGPFVVVMFLETLGKQKVTPWIDFCALYLGCLNSTANPIVYMTLNGNFRKEFTKLCMRKSQSQNADAKNDQQSPKLAPRFFDK